MEIGTKDCPEVGKRPLHSEEPSSEECRKLRTELNLSTAKFQKASKQIAVLKSKAGDLKKRYEKSGAYTFRYTYHLQLSTVVGMLNVYQEYARVQAAKIARLREDLYWANKYEETDESEDEDDGDISDDGRWKQRYTMSGIIGERNLSFVTAWHYKRPLARVAKLFEKKQLSWKLLFIPYFLYQKLIFWYQETDFFISRNRFIDIKKYFLIAKIISNRNLDIMKPRILDIKKWKSRYKKSI